MICLGTSLLVTSMPAAGPAQGRAMARPPPPATGHVTPGSLARYCKDASKTERSAPTFSASLVMNCYNFSNLICEIIQNVQSVGFVQFVLLSSECYHILVFCRLAVSCTEALFIIYLLFKVWTTLFAFFNADREWEDGVLMY